MRTADGLSWELYKRDAGRNPSTVAAGWLKLKTQWQVFGETNGLDKRFALKTWVDSWTWDPDFQLKLDTSTLTLSMTLSPRIICESYGAGAGITPKPCGVPAGSLDKTLQLRAGAGRSDSRKEFTISFDWTLANGYSTPDLALFSVTPDLFAYKVKPSWFQPGL